jgi:hypothetical protein
MKEEEMTGLVETTQLFMEALGRREFRTVQQCFAPEVRFRALVPPGLRDAAEASGAVEHLQRWFGEADHFELLRSEVEPTADRVRFRYQIRLHDEDGWSVIDQSGYTDGADRIESLDLVCSGFRPAEPPEAVQRAQASSL